MTALINDSTAPQRVVLLTGQLDGIPDNGRVTYLTGHDYSVNLPVTSNPLTSSVRIFFNSLLESGVATNAVQPDVIFTISAPTLIQSNSIFYTINYSNPGPRMVENIVITDSLPSGAEFVSATDNGTNVNGVVTWNLPPLVANASGSVGLEISVSGGGAYTNTAQMRFSHIAARKIASNAAVTIVDAPPVLDEAVWLSDVFQFRVRGLPGSNYVVEATTNFVQWTDLTTNIGPAFRFTNSPPNPRINFFRARLIP